VTTDLLAKSPVVLVGGGGLDHTFSWPPPKTAVWLVAIWLRWTLNNFLTTSFFRLMMECNAWLLDWKFWAVCFVRTRFLGPTDLWVRAGAQTIDKTVLNLRDCTLLVSAARIWWCGCCATQVLCTFGVENFALITHNSMSSLWVWHVCYVWTSTFYTHTAVAVSP